MSGLTSMLTKRCESFANDSASPASSNVTSEDLVVAVFDALTGLHLPFMISGSLASNFYGVPRATQDADLVLELDKLPIDAFAARLGDRYEVDPQLAFETVTGSRRLVVRAAESAFYVELFDVTDDRHDRERFLRRRVVEVLELAGRRKDFEDARNVMAVQRDALDHDYLGRWCRELGLLDQLEALKGPLQ